MVSMSLQILSIKKVAYRKYTETKAKPYRRGKFIQSLYKRLWMGGVSHLAEKQEKAQLI